MHDQLTHQLSADRTGRACCRAVACRPRCYRTYHCMSHRFCGLIVSGIFVYLLGQIRCRCRWLPAPDCHPPNPESPQSPPESLSGYRCRCPRVPWPSYNHCCFPALPDTLFSRRRVGIRLVYVVFASSFLPASVASICPCVRAISATAAYFTDQLSRLQAFLLFSLSKIGLMLSLACSVSRLSAATSCC